MRMDDGTMKMFDSEKALREFAKKESIFDVDDRIFHEGEIVEIKGHKFRIVSIHNNGKMILKGARKQ